MAGVGISARLKRVNCWVLINTSKAPWSTTQRWKHVMQHRYTYTTTYWHIQKANPLPLQRCRGVSSPPRQLRLSPNGTEGNDQGTLLQHFAMGFAIRLCGLGAWFFHTRYQYSYYSRTLQINEQLFSPLNELIIFLLYKHWLWHWEISEILE